MIPINPASWGLFTWSKQADMAPAVLKAYADKLIPTCSE